MTHKVSREEMVARIVALDPCHEPGWVAEKLSRMPARLSNRDVVRLSAGDVTDADRLWLAFRLAPRELSERVMRNAVLRAVRVYVADALDAARLPSEAAKLRALPDSATYEELRIAAACAARGGEAAEAEAAWAAAAAAARAEAAARAAAAAAAWAAAWAAAAAEAAAEAAARAAAEAAAWGAARAAERSLQLSDFLGPLT